MTERKGILGALGAIVGGSRVRRSAVVFTMAVGSAFAISGSCGSCSPGPVAPPPPPPPPITSTVDSTSSTDTTGGATTSTAGGEPSRCVFVRPEAAREMGPVPQSRIVGGTPALPGEAPWMTSLQVTNMSGPDAHFCGGAVEAERYILTASHCVQHTGRMRVVVGRHDLRMGDGWEFMVTANDVMMPARVDADGKVQGLYDSGTLDWDVALIDIGGPAGVESLELYTGPLRTLEGTKYKPKETQAYGWGRVYSGGPISPQLQRMQQTPPVMAQDACNAYYDNLTTHMICSDIEGFGSCQGDSGGPLLIDGKRVGVVSFGRGCAQGWPGVYAYVGAPQDSWSGPAAFSYSGELAEWIQSCTEQ